MKERILFLFCRRFSCARDLGAAAKRCALQRTSPATRQARTTRRAWAPASRLREEHAPRLARARHGAIACVPVRARGPRRRCRRPPAYITSGYAHRLGRHAAALAPAGRCSRVAPHNKRYVLRAAVRRTGPLGSDGARPLRVPLRLRVGHCSQRRPGHRHARVSREEGGSPRRSTPSSCRRESLRRRGPCPAGF